MAHNLLELLECQICTEIFNEAERKPKVLPCQHTLCLHCMNKLARRDETKLEYTVNGFEATLVLKCPTCNAEYEAPENDVDKFPNNITMIAFLSVAPSDKEKAQANPQSRTSIKQCVAERVQHLRDKIAETQVTHIKKMSSWEAEVDEAKQTIRTHCARFKQAIERREADLVAELDNFNAKRQTSSEATNAEFHHQLMDMSNFCDQVEKQLKGSKERKATQNLDKCLEMIETLESSSGTDHGSTNGSKWLAKFQPDRKDTVHASIAMFGQFILQEPGAAAVKKKLLRQKYATETIKRVYTRESLLRIQPHCTRKPKDLVNIPGMTIVEIDMTDVASMMRMNQAMIENQPLTLHLININRQPEAVTIGREQVFTLDPSDDIDIYTSENVTRRALPEMIREAATTATEQEEDWCPPRLVLGSQSRDPFEKFSFPGDQPIPARRAKPAVSAKPRPKSLFQMMK